MCGHTYEIIERQPGQRRAGHLALAIDGVDTLYTCDPSQFMTKASAAVIAAGMSPGPQATLAALEVCKEYATRSLQRVVKALNSGRRGGQGLLSRGIGPGSMGDFVARTVAGYTAAEKAAMPPGDEEKAVHWFIERGRLARATDRDRAELLKHRNELTDQELERRRNRCRLDRIEKQLRHVEQAMQTHEAGSATRLRLERRLAELLTEKASLEHLIVCATHGFQYAAGQFAQGAVDLVNDDIRYWPLMTDTTADTERDGIETFSDLATVDEFDGSGYSSGGLALDNQSVDVDDANDLAKFTADDEVVTLGAGTRSIAGGGLGKFNTNTAGSLLLHWLEFASAKTPDGSQFTFDFSGDGILQFA